MIIPHPPTAILLLLLLAFTPPASAARASLPGTALSKAQHWDTAHITALAERYEHGRGVGRDLHQAYALYCLGATRGDPEAAYSLRWLIDRFDGRIPLALAAYNAGEHAVDRHKGIPAYKETRRYVQRITRQVAVAASDGEATTAAVVPAKRRSRQASRLARMLQPAHKLVLFD